MSTTTIIKTFWNLLDGRHRRFVCILLAMMVATMLLELLGLGLVMPAVGLMANGDVGDLPGRAAVLKWLGNPDRSSLLLIGLGALLTLSVGKMLFIIFFNYCQARFVASLESRLATRLFSIYMHQPWTFHLERNSSYLVRNIYEIQAIGSLLVSLLVVVAECIVLIGVIVVLVRLEPVGTLVIGAVLGGFSVLLIKATARRSRTWGEAKCEHFNQLQRHLQQGLGGVKDARLRGAERSFVERFSRSNRIVSRMTAFQVALQSVPRLWLEFAAIAAIGLLSATLLWLGRKPSEIVPSLALFAAAAFKVMPAANRVTICMQTLRFAERPLRMIREELSLERTDVEPGPSPFVFRDEIVIENVTYRFPSAATPALDGVTLRFGHGQSVGVIGGSGAGKSTAVDILLGLLEPESGRVTVDGVDIRTNPRTWQQMVGYVPQSIYLCDESLRENIAFGVPPERIDDDAVRRALVAARLDDFVASLPSGLDTVVGERGVRLSGGQRQRIGIARALYHDPEVLVLDEATSALDTRTESEVMEAVNSLHGTKTIIIVAHRLSTVDRCDVLYRLERGRVVKCGSFAEVV